MVSRSTGRALMVESNKNLLDPWRSKVTSEARAMAQAIDWQPIPSGAAVGVTISFIFNRPKNHFGTGKNSAVVKALAPRFPSSAPDIDKLTRAILDALTDARVWADDGQVVWLKVSEHYVDQSWPSGEGVHVTLGVMK